MLCERFCHSNLSVYSIIKLDIGFKCVFCVCVYVFLEREIKTRE